MRKIAIGGRGLVRAETDKSGELKFRKESEAETLGLGRGGGVYTDAQAYEESEFRVQQLSGAIKEGIGANTARRSTRDRGASMASKAASTMSQALADNAGQVQQAMEKADPKAKDEMKNFSKLLAKRQKLADSKTGYQDKEKAKEMDIQIQKSKMKLEKYGGGADSDLAKSLNLAQVGKDLESEQGMSTLGGFIPLNKTGRMDFFGVDSDAGPAGTRQDMKDAFNEKMEGRSGFFDKAKGVFAGAGAAVDAYAHKGSAIGQAFDPNRMFGAGSGLAKMFGGKETDAIQEQVDQELAVEDQMEGCLLYTSPSPRD